MQMQDLGGVITVQWHGIVGRIQQYFLKTSLDKNGIDRRTRVKLSVCKTALNPLFLHISKILIKEIGLSLIVVNR
jgi:hypothetical protein